MGMEDREDGIDSAYQDTYSWVFDSNPKTTSTDKQLNAHARLLSWLKNDDKLFWISGRAGCGKSTLMKFLYHHEETKKALSQWADGQPLIMVAYFFFERGFDLQKSREGMLRSVLHQILTARREIIPIVFNDLREYSSSSGSFEIALLDRLNWQHLPRYLTRAINALGESKMCLFIDGLDEYRMMDKSDDYPADYCDLLYDNSGDASWGLSKFITEGHKEIALLMRQLTNESKNIKICLSSRELLVFDNQFRQLSRVRVHELTSADISRYCEGKLEDLAPDLEDRPEFARRICQKSEGIFLVSSSWEFLYSPVIMRFAARDRGLALNSTDSFRTSQPEFPQPFASYSLVNGIVLTQTLLVGPHSCQSDIRW